MPQQFISLIRKQLYTLSFVSLLLLLVITRLYKLPTSLEFFADIGRDHWMLWKAVDSRKPPLLGPSISAFPFYQSPAYFYLNMPIFLLTQGSPYTTVLTILAVYLVCLSLAWWMTKDHPSLRQFVLVATLLMLVHPEFVAQMRYPWNPSFAAPFLLLALLSVLLLLKKQFRPLNVWVYHLSIIFAVGLSYSNIPFFLALSVLMMWLLRKQRQLWLHFFVSLLISALIVFGPVLFFELRHNFLLVKGVLNWQGSTVVEEQSISEKTLELTRYVLGIKRWGVPEYMSILKWVLLIIWSAHWYISKHHLSQKKLFVTASVSLLGLGLLYLLFPFSVFSHYVFAVIIVFFYTISTLQKPFRFLVILLLLLVWLQPWQVARHFATPNRTIAQLNHCSQQVCQQLSQPMSVTVTAWHRFHYAPEWQFFFAKNGCQVIDQSMENTAPQYLTVVADQSSFELGKSQFDELSRFGEATEEKVVSCEGNIQVHVLKKK